MKIIKINKRCYMRTSYFMFLKIENRKQFLIVKPIFFVSKNKNYY